MSLTSTLAVSFSVNGPGLSDTFPPPQSPETNTNAPQAGPMLAPTVSGTANFAVPTGATQLLIVPPSGSQNVKQIKTVSGDTGISFTNQLIKIPVAGISTVYVVATAVEALSFCWG